MDASNYNTVGWNMKFKARKLDVIFQLPKLKYVGFFRWFFSALMIFLMVGVVSAQQGPHDVVDSRIIQMVSDTTVDTSRVVKFTPALAVMGFTYKDSIDYQADTGAHQTISWTSPMQIMIFTPTMDTTTTYQCSIYFAGTSEFGFDLLPDDLELDTTLEYLIDTMVYLFNNTTTMKDSVLAQDSVTYIKLVSKHGEGVMQGPWTMDFTAVGGAGTMDTAGAADSVTIAMVCDSMVKYTNDDAGVDSFMTAYDSTTFYIVQSDQAGLLFHDTIDAGMHADTHAVWAESQANKADSSAIDSTYDLCKIYNANVMDISIILSGPITPYAGAGNVDTGKIILYSYSNRQTTTHLTKYCAALPCTLLYAIVGELADSTLLPNLKANIVIQDSLSDTGGIAMPYNLRWEVLLK